MGKFVKVAETGEIPPGKTKLVIVNEERIALYNVDGSFYATADTCTHAEASLAEGTLEGEVIECPRHGAKFNVKTGRVLTLPAVVPVKTYAVRVEGSDILVEVEEG
ncbi:MAG: non-heme iron oxygenase ferredoxin subunit [Nitrospinota bacterium]|nr:MAG: non-heme iron oxygenase ferredoxin subunit [Nitrospinota bacterium]